MVFPRQWDSYFRRHLIVTSYSWELLKSGICQLYDKSLYLHGGTAVLSLSTKTFQEQPAGRNAGARFAPSHPQGPFSPSSHCCSLDPFVQMQPAPWVLSPALAAARSLSHCKTRAKTK